MKNILYAIQDSDLEDIIKENLDGNQYRICGTALYQEAVLNDLVTHNPDVLILRTGLQGTKSLEELIYEIKNISRNIQIILLLGNGSNNQILIERISRYGVYDILNSPIKVDEIIDCIVNPRTISAISTLAPTKSSGQSEYKDTINDVNIIVDSGNNSDETVIREKIKSRGKEDKSLTIKENNKDDTLTKEEQKEYERVMSEITSEKDDFIKEEDINEKVEREKINNESVVSNNESDIEDNIENKVSDDKKNKDDIEKEVVNDVKESEKDDYKIETEDVFSNIKSSTYSELEIVPEDIVDLSNKKISSNKKKGFSRIFRRTTNPQENFKEIKQKVILVVAPESGLGVSTIATNFAVNLSKIGQTLLCDMTDKQKIMAKLNLNETSDNFININTLRLSVKSSDISRISKLPVNLNYASKTDKLSDIIKTAKKDHMFIVIAATEAVAVSYMKYCDSVIFITSQQRNYLKDTVSLINRSRVIRNTLKNEIVIINRYNSSGIKDYVVQQMTNVEMVFSLPDDYSTILKADKVSLPETCCFPKSALCVAIKNISDCTLKT